ncbi:MAG: FAD-dependent oxidoreductase [Anaerolineales bacterium]|nr:FAD-dependent oxidoreductase [Anaerolineales bacterium]
MPTKSRFDTDVLIVGSGPIGLTLALDLAARGVRTLVVEQRAREDNRRVKCNHISARSMEIFRRLGVARALRDHGLPADHPNDCAFRTTFTGQEIARIPIPARQDRYTARYGPDTWWPTPEPPHRINQIYMEPILWDYAAAQDNITIWAEADFVSFSQDQEMVTGEIRSAGDYGPESVTARFLMGCDGGRSEIRRAIGAEFVGDAVVQRVQSSYIRAPKLLEMSNYPPAWGTINLNPRRSGTLYAIDGKETFLVHNYLRPDETDFDAIDRDWSIRTILGVDDSFEYELISNEDWIGRRLVADKFRQDRVFICGDAAHIWVPYAGYGMNAGIADAANLAWLLAAHINGWAPYSILDAYEKERLPITEQVSHFAMNHAHEMIKNRRRVPADIEEESPAGAASRAEFGQELYDLNVQQYCCGGLNFGYYYDQSPLIIYDDEPQPSYSMANFTSSTVPGCRLPHFWLPTGHSLYDIIGGDYALLRFDREADVKPLLDAAAAAGVPLQLVELEPFGAPTAYTTRLVLARPDQHVAWRGDDLPEEVAAMIATITGRA